MPKCCLIHKRPLQYTVICPDPKNPDPPKNLSLHKKKMCAFCYFEWENKQQMINVKINQKQSIQIINLQVNM